MPCLNLQTISRQFSTRFSIIHASQHPRPPPRPSTLIYSLVRSCFSSFSSSFNRCPCWCGSISTTTDAVCVRNSLIILANAEKVTLDLVYVDIDIHVMWCEMIVSRSPAGCWMLAHIFIQINNKICMYSNDGYNDKWREFEQKRRDMQGKGGWRTRNQSQSIQTKFLTTLSHKLRSNDTK